MALRNVLNTRYRFLNLPTNVKTQRSRHDGRHTRLYAGGPDYYVRALCQRLRIPGARSN